MESVSQKISELCVLPLFRCILSIPEKKEQEYKKITFRKLDSNWQIEKFTSKQVFHENIQENELETRLFQLMDNNFKQLTVFTEKEELTLKISKKGKVLTNKNSIKQQINIKEQHNRIKKYLLPEGEIVLPLVDMGVFTPSGQVVKAKYYKYKQINRFIELVDDVLKNYPEKEITIVDFGCGKSYLTFILYHYLTNIRSIQAKIIGLDLKEDVVHKCNLAAKKYGYHNLHFEVGNIEKYTQTKAVDMVITLHACDTATDYALAKAVEWNSEFILSVPCCQHELNGQIKSDTFSLLTKYGIIKERVSALVTDAIRANMLEANGYKTQLIEFIDMEHTPKNILIRSVKGRVSLEKQGKCLQEVENITKELNLTPTIVELLQKKTKLI